MEANALFKELPAVSRELITDLAQRANALGYSVFLVGGLIRDTYLSSKANQILPRQRLDELDIDLALLGDTPEFVRQLRASGSCGDWIVGPAQIFKKYGTAKVAFRNKQLACSIQIDFAQCRQESFSGPAAIPSITPARSIEEDLFRRDFAINAMALELGSQGAMRLVDPFDGVGDLNSHWLRVLHMNSFCDDPVRILRGIRFSLRFGFTFATETHARCRQALELQYLTLVSPYRRFDEFRKSFLEVSVDRVLARYHELGVLEQLHPLLELAYCRSSGENVARLGEVPAGLERVATFLRALDRSELDTLCEDLAIRKNEQQVLQQGR